MKEGLRIAEFAPIYKKRHPRRSATIIKRSLASENGAITPYNYHFEDTCLLEAES
jgi:hypothetical protein